MAQVATGHVSDRPFGRTVFTIGAKRFSGDLILTANRRSYKIGWRNGHVVAASSPAPADSFGRIGVAVGMVTSEQLADFLRAQTLRGRAHSQLDLIAEIAGLSPEQIVNLKRHTMVRSALRVFALEDATFALETEPSLEPDPAVPAVDPRWLIYKGVRAYFKLPRLVKELGPYAASRFRLSDASVSTLGSYGFGDAEKRLLLHLHKQPVTIAELRENVAPSEIEAALAIIYTLATTGCLEELDSEGKTTDVVPPTLSGPPAQAVAAIARGRAQKPASADPAPAAPAKRAAPAPAKRPAPAPTVSQTPAPTKRAAPAPTVSQTPAPTKRAAPAPAKPATHTPTMRATPAPARPAAPTRTEHPANESTQGARETTAASEIRALIRAKLREIDSGADHFTLVGVSRGASAAETQLRYFSLAKQLHPDRLRAMGVADLDAEAQKVFSAINVAFGVLSNASKRAEYENVLAAGGAEALRAKEQQAEEQAIKILSAENEFQLGVMALRRNHYRAALESFEKAVELNPEEGEHHAMYAWALWCSTQDKESVAKEVRQSISRALSISPKCVPAYFYRGQIAKQQGKTDTAIECFREVLRLDANHRDAQLELRLLSERGGSKGGEKKGSLLDRLKRK